MTTIKSFERVKQFVDFEALLHQQFVTVTVRNKKKLDAFGIKEGAIVEGLRWVNGKNVPAVYKITKIRFALHTPYGADQRHGGYVWMHGNLKLASGEFGTHEHNIGSPADIYKIIS